MKIIIAAGLLIAGIVHLIPVTGVGGATRLQTLYGIAVTDGDLLILMRHRAVMFGLLGAFLCLAAFRPDLQWLAITAGLLSAIAFIVIAQQQAVYGDAITRVVIADVVAIIALLMSAIAKVVSN